MSIAVLREFISKRKQEHEAKLSKRRSASKVIEKDSSEALKDETSIENGINNGEHKLESEDEPSSASKEPAKTTEGFAPREPKPPKVLEVFLHSLFDFWFISLLVVILQLDKSSCILKFQALSASGLRALRYAREIEGIGQVVALDNDLGNFFLNLMN